MCPGLGRTHEFVRVLTTLLGILRSSPSTPDELPNFYGDLGSP